MQIVFVTGLLKSPETAKSLRLKDVERTVLNRDNIRKLDRAMMGLGQRPMLTGLGIVAALFRSNSKDHSQASDG